MIAVFSRLLILPAALFLMGCGSSEPPLAPVSGTVYYNDAPLTSGTVVFVPDAARGGSGPLACAQIQSDGSFQLKSGDKLGAVAGWHRVTIASPLASSNRDQRIPAHYCDPDLSGQQCEVRAGTGNRIDFHLR